MQVIVDCEGAEVPLLLEPEWKVSQLKEALKKAHSFATEGSITVFFADRLLEDEENLSDTGITSDCKLKAFSRNYLQIRWQEPEEDKKYTLCDGGFTLYVQKKSRKGGYGTRARQSLPPGNCKWFMRISSQHAAVGIDTDPTAPGFFGSKTGKFVAIGLNEERENRLKFCGRLDEAMTLELCLARDEKVLKVRDAASGEDGPWKTIGLDDPASEYYITCYPAHECAISILDDKETKTTVPEDED